MLLIFLIFLNIYIFYKYTIIDLGGDKIHETMDSIHKKSRFIRMYCYITLYYRARHNSLLEKKNTT